MASVETSTSTAEETMVVEGESTDSVVAEAQSPTQESGETENNNSNNNISNNNNNNTDRYLVLVEFVYRHLNFQMAELESMLETHGIALGSDACRIVPLPTPANKGSRSKGVVSQKNRGFTILSFASEQAPKWSGLLQTHEEQRKHSKFDPSISLPSRTNNGSDGNDGLSIADILYKCTLVKSVVELWGASSVDLKDCAFQAFEWLNAPSSSSSSSSFQKDSIWPLVCKETERPWKFTIHTLGTKVTREEQDEMRQTFRNTLDCLLGPVKLKDPTAQEFLLIREIELDGKGSPLWAKKTKEKDIGNHHQNKNPVENQISDATATANETETEITPKGRRAYCTDAIAYYFGRVLGGRMRNNGGSRGLEHYSLKSRPYLGPTSMDDELSFVMTSLGKVTKGTIVFDPFVGTGSILLSCAMRGAYCIGSDIDIRVIRGKGGNQTIWKNFEHYGLPRPEIVRSDNALYHRHYRHHPYDIGDKINNNSNNSNSNSNSSDIAPPLYDAILCDPPYGIRAGARQTGSKLDKPRPVLEENRHDHIAQTRAYAVSDVMSDLLDVAASTLKMGGRLVYIIPSFQDFDEDTDLPMHDCLELVHTCYQPFSLELGRRIVAMTKISHYEVSKREDYRSTIWKHGAASAEKCANLREKIMEAAKLKPGYEEKAAIRKEKRRVNKQAKKKEKKARLLQQQHQQLQQKQHR